MPTLIFIPIISKLALIQSSSISTTNSLLDAVWKKYLHPEQVKLSQLSLRTLKNPVPIEPTDTLYRRVMVSAHGSGWEHTVIEGVVPSSWCDSDNVHVFLYVDQGVAMQAAENLYEKLWGQDLNDNLKVLSEDSDGRGTWKYLPKEYLDSLQLPFLGYLEDVLLFRDEYSTAMEAFNPEETMKGGSRGVVVTGHPGIGKSCFLFYLLLQKLSEKTPVALEQPDHFFLFSNEGVTMHAKITYTCLFPRITWALSDSNEEAEQPCAAFLDAHQWGRTWVVQTVSPLKEKWKKWQERYSAGMYIMKYSSIDEITALGKIHRLDVPRLRRIYNEWGPSTRDCLNLSRHRSAEVLHGAEVIQAAKDFIKSAPTTSRVNMVTASHILFKMEPEGVTEELRQISIWSIATDRIKDIILYAAAEADAQVRIKFYQTISKHPRLKTFVGQMFEDIVLAWFYSHSNGHMPCVAAQGTYSLQIPACGEDHTVFFGNNIAAMQTNVLAKTLPLLLLPLSPSFADAIVLTEKFIITIQATIAYRHSVDPRGFAIIEEYLPRTTKRSKEWCHVFITNDENGAAFLRSQFLSNLPSHIQIYSAVFDVGTPGILPSILRKHVEGFNDRRKRELCNQRDNADMVVE